MNTIKEIVNDYNTLILDIKNLIKDVSEIIEKDNRISFQYEGWLPRDRPAWSLKDTYSKKFTNSNSIFYLGIDLTNDNPYLLLFYISVCLENCRINELTEYDAFAYIDNQEIHKKEITTGVYSFKQEWGECIYSKINLLEIASREVVSTDLSSIIDFLFTQKNNIMCKDIKFV
jgi:hypothetical protein